jgi:hypothetical protein
MDCMSILSMYIHSSASQGLDVIPMILLWFAGDQLRQMILLKLWVELIPHTHHFQILQVLLPVRNWVP